MMVEIFAQISTPPVPQITGWFELLGYIAMLGFMGWNTWLTYKSKQSVEDVKEHGTKTAQLVQASVVKQGQVLGEIKEITNGRLDTALAKINSLETRVADLLKIISERQP